MSFNKISGQEHALLILRQSLIRSTPAHAYLFHGRESVGKKLAALEFAKALNCHTAAGDACDQCASCRKIDAGLHPDIFLVAPEKSSTAAKEGFIRIEDIRRLQGKLNYLPYEGKVKVAIIDQAEQMNLQAANAFLKTLEEPPRATIIILISPQSGQLPSTIVSRCHGIKFFPLPASTIRHILQARDPGLDDAQAETLASRANGQMSRALEEDPFVAADSRDSLLELLSALTPERIDLVFQYARTWSKKTEDLFRLLEELQHLLRDLAVARVNGPPRLLLNQDLAARLRLIGGQRELAAWLRMFQSAAQTRQALQANLNAQLWLENMLLQFCAAH